MTLMKISRPALMASFILFGGYGFTAKAADDFWPSKEQVKAGVWAAKTVNKAVCDLGKQQSPVDITTGKPAQMTAIKFHYQSQPLGVVNDGHSILVSVKDSDKIEVDGESYTLAQYHFHHPAEHSFAGKRAPMELHLVHQNDKNGEFLVLAVTMVPGPANAAFEAILKAAPLVKGPGNFTQEIMSNPADLLPAKPGYYSYKGSLTTEPCVESVHWILFKQAIQVSQDQIDRFGKIFPNNARPVQPLNQRVIMQTAE